MKYINICKYNKEIQIILLDAHTKIMFNAGATAEEMAKHLHLGRGFGKSLSEALIIEKIVNK